MSTQSAGKLIKHLIAKNGPMTTQSLFTHIPNHPEQLSLEGEGVLHKKINRDSTLSKPVWEWNFTSAEDIQKYKKL
ncbi:hypothetical protein CU098_009683 [Rhizopus stolonifer]|uniref:Uncharacterized protein n=1 Tax=Rhizopus stolonifer TaxID=4846 RepID=A0A367KJN5_RHIST|nr:hypothetical protein CU098_009683 [Rhizopus stolonifer]